MSVCNISSSVSQDAAFSNVVVGKSLVACRIASNSLNVNGASIENLVTNNLVVKNSISIDSGGTDNDGFVALEYLADDLNTATADSEGVLSLSGSGGNVTNASGSTVTVTNQRYYTPYVVGTNETEYSTVQSAINAAPNGSMIFIREGVHIENVTVNKTLSLMGPGTGVGNPVITGVITITAPGCVLTSLSLSSPTICLDIQNDTTLYSCTVQGGTVGIRIGNNVNLYMYDCSVSSSVTTVEDNGNTGIFVIGFNTFFQGTNALTLTGGTQFNAFSCAAVGSVFVGGSSLANFKNWNQFGGDFVCNTSQGIILNSCSLQNFFFINSGFPIALLGCTIEGNTSLQGTQGFFISCSFIGTSSTITMHRGDIRFEGSTMSHRLVVDDTQGRSLFRWRGGFMATNTTGMNNEIQSTASVGGPGNSGILFEMANSNIFAPLFISADDSLGAVQIPTVESSFSNVVVQSIITTTINNTGMNPTNTLSVKSCDVSGGFTTAGTSLHVSSTTMDNRLTGTSFSVSDPQCVISNCTFIHNLTAPLGLSSVSVLLSNCLFNSEGASTAASLFSGTVTCTNNSFVTTAATPNAIFIVGGTVQTITGTNSLLGYTGLAAVTSNVGTTA